jgi:hypothetical protein
LVSRVRKKSRGLEFFASVLRGWEEQGAMKASKFSDAQKAFILKQGEVGLVAVRVA